jgi:hypothetical protein
MAELPGLSGTSFKMARRSARKQSLFAVNRACVDLPLRNVEDLHENCLYRCWFLGRGVWMPILDERLLFDRAEAEATES